MCDDASHVRNIFARYFFFFFFCAYSAIEPTPVFTYATRDGYDLSLFSGQPTAAAGFFLVLLPFIYLLFIFFFLSPSSAKQCSYIDVYIYINLYTSIFIRIYICRRCRRMAYVTNCTRATGFHRHPATPASSTPWKGTHKIIAAVRDLQ